MDSWLGLDLGKYTDFAALSVMARHLAVDATTGLPRRDSTGAPKCFWQVRALKRWPLKTPYEKITPDVVRIARRPDLGANVRVVVDQTGVGASPTENIRTALTECEEIEVWGISITAGETWRLTGRKTVNCSKVLLTSALHEALGGGRLKLCPRDDGRPMENANVLEKELAAFRVRISQAGNTTYGADQSDHDDVVISIALPIWLGGIPFMRAYVDPDGPGVIPETADCWLKIEAMERQALRLEQYGPEQSPDASSNESGYWYDDPKLWTPA